MHIIHCGDNMKIIVQKYGGSSLKDKNSMELVCNKIKSKLNSKSKVIAIVSAQGKTTNELIHKANEYAEKVETDDDNKNTDKNTKIKKEIIDKYSLDFLLSTGEMQSASLLSIMLNSKGINTICMTGYQAGIITNSNFTEAKIIDVIPDNILRKLESVDVIIITGFQGIDVFGNITTLGRGGSDLSAVAIAASLNLPSCEIYSDTNGIYTADPNIVKNAKKINKVSYKNMLEAASNGAKVLNNRAVNLAQKYDIEIKCKNTYTSSYGSTIQQSVTEKENYPILAKKDDLSKISITGNLIKSNLKVHTILFNILNEYNIPYYMIDSNELNLSVIVDSKNADTLIQLLHEKLI